MIRGDDNVNDKNMADPPAALTTPTISRERTKTYNYNEKKGLDKLSLTPQKEGAVKIANSSNSYQLGIT